MSIILGIETSCDECCAAIVKNGKDVLSNIVYSQIEIHKSFGGVVPEIASRNHVLTIEHVVDKAIKEADIKNEDIDAIAVTYAPGLIGPLLVGLSFAKAFSYALDIPLIAVHHLDGHLCANYLAYKELTPPLIALILSGGHSHFYYTDNHGSYKNIGLTRDDALGEAFDKVARMLNLPYPGGPYIEKLAEKGESNIDLPIVLLEKESLDFSFSGIKSKVSQILNKGYKNEDIAASFQDTVFKIVEEKIKRVSRLYKGTKIVVAGGVASNKNLRNRLKKLNLDILYPSIEYCTDNAAMIAAAGYYKYKNKEYSDLTLNAFSSKNL